MAAEGAEMSECVKCGQEIGCASYCGCGWRKAKNDKPLSEPTALCAYMACNKPSICKIKVAKNAWSNFCQQHYIEWHRRKAEETCLDLGLKTTEEKREWVRNAVNKLATKMRPDYLKDDEAA
jgi:hypothetical protein